MQDFHLGELKLNQKRKEKRKERKKEKKRKEKKPIFTFILLLLLKELSYGG